MVRGRGEGFDIGVFVVVGEVRGSGGREEETSWFVGGGAIDGGEVRGGVVGRGDGRGESLTGGGGG